MEMEYSTSLAPKIVTEYALQWVASVNACSMHRVTNMILWRHDTIPLTGNCLSESCTAETLFGFFSLVTQYRTVKLPRVDPFPQCCSDIPEGTGA